MEARVMILQRLSGSQFQEVIDFKGTFKFKGSTLGALSRRSVVSATGTFTPKPLSPMNAFPWHQLVTARISFLIWSDLL